jgi:hypothetical protein
VSVRVALRTNAVLDVAEPKREVGPSDEEVELLVQHAHAQVVLARDDVVARWWVMPPAAPDRDVADAA